MPDITRRVEFLFDFMSPTAYLAFTQLPDLAKRCDSEIVWRPMLTLRLHELVGNRSPMAVPAKGAWVMADLMRFAKRYDVPFGLNPNFPMKLLDALHGAVIALQLGVIEDYCAALYPAVWGDSLFDVDDRNALRRHLDARGVDADPIMQRLDAPEIAATLMQNCQEAADRGAFGAPTFFVHRADGQTEMHFGQDRLDFVEEALRIE